MCKALYEHQPSISIFYIQSLINITYRVTGFVVIADAIWGVRVCAGRLFFPITDGVGQRRNFNVGILGTLRQYFLVNSYLESKCLSNTAV